MRSLRCQRASGEAGPGTSRNFAQKNFFSSGLLGIARPEIAVRLRKETTLSVKQIAARLHLGSPASASLCLLTAVNNAASAMATIQGRLGL